MSLDNNIIWQGVYQDFGDSNVCKQAFNSRQWLDKITTEAEHTINQIATCSQTIPSVATGSDYLLPIVAALVANLYQKLVILDFGGGLATSYVSVRTSLATATELQFHIVEEHAVCQQGEKIFAQHATLHFHTKLPTLAIAPQIIHAGSSLHYVEHWQALLDEFAAYHAKYVLLADLLAGDIPTFVSKQQYYDYQIPVWFWNIQEIIDHMATLNYYLAFNSHLQRCYHGTSKPLPMHNLPKEYQLDYPCQLLFIRND